MIWAAQVVILVCAMSSASWLAAADELQFDTGGAWQVVHVSVGAALFEENVAQLATAWTRILEVEKEKGTVISYTVTTFANPGYEKWDVMLFIERQMPAAHALPIVWVAAANHGRSVSY